MLSQQGRGHTDDFFLLILLNFNVLAGACFEQKEDPVFPFYKAVTEIHINLSHAFLIHAKLKALFHFQVNKFITFLQINIILSDLS